MEFTTTVNVPEIESTGIAKSLAVVLSNCEEPKASLVYAPKHKLVARLVAATVGKMELDPTQHQPDHCDRDQERA